ncbi:MAG: hypothetical protein LQ349_005561 [Xanthoria aureola]|nr:MAG: hypothetical protein LQ349_005561 [Xanthoria aureola]
MAPKGDLKDLKAVRITPSGYQQGLGRLSDIQPPPLLAPYRNNLVACSQYYNLCFVASRDRILVHSPIFLDHMLLPPRSIIDLASSNTGLTGYIDPGHPHSINQLVVSDLGLEELVIAVTDDGDVVAYMTRSIRDDINHHGLAYNSPYFHSAVRPYFLRNVHNSAWGVALHQEARMIAVSSNSAKIHVFAFALGHSSSDHSGVVSSHHSAGLDALGSLDSSEWVRVGPKDSLMPCDRSRNLEIILEQHLANIPNIAFYNPYNRDVNDIYLISTDIQGVTYMWHVWKRMAVAKLSSAPSRGMGWGLACIDPFFAQEAKSAGELLGMEHGIDMSSGFIQTTDSLRHVPDYETVHFTARHRMKNRAATLDVHVRTDVGDLDDDIDDLGDEFDDLEEEDDMDSDSEDHDSPTEGEENSFIGRPGDNSWTAPTPAHFILEATAEVPSPVKQFTFCVLRTTRHDVRLLKMLHTTTGTPTQTTSLRSASEVLCRSVLDQDLHPDDLHLRRLQRLNMVHQVPELNLVIIGDQMGRVAVLSITRRKAQTGYGTLDDFGFRVEAFLPPKSQEDQGQRPRTDLLGVAVGPVQGHEQQREDLLDAAAGEHLKRRRIIRSRPYRIILYYLDHTVLSYEITR